nr:AzlC family ABC transporter permease [uncultured Oscillibacter sp.]
MERLEKTEYHTPKNTAPRAAFSATIPVLTGYIPLGMAYGFLMASVGYGPLWALGMSALVFAGSLEYMAVTLLTAAFAPAQAFLVAVMINARHIFYGISLLDKYRGIGGVRPFLIFALTDETFSLVSTMEPPEGVGRGDFYFWVSLLDYIYWLAGSFLGAAVGSVLTVNTRGMDFVLTALFVVLFMEQWKKKERRAAGIAGLVCMAAGIAAFGPENPLLPAMALILAVLLGGRRWLCV